MKDRLKKKLKSKKVAKQLQTEKPKVYEMPDDYKRDLELLSEALHMHEEYTAKLPLLHGEDKIKFADALKGLDKRIELFEGALAKCHESHQKKMQSDEKLGNAIEKASETVEQIYIAIKTGTPHKFDEFHEVVTRDMTEEELQEFLDRIAVREANVSQTLLVPPVAE